MDPIEQKIREKLANILVGEKNLLDTNIIDSLELKEKTAYLHLLVAKNIKGISDLQKKIKNALEELKEIEVVRFSLNYKKEEITEKRQPPKVNVSPKNTSLLQNYKNIIVVGSGKGGVGKSTVALNLALALQKKKFQVALFDADIYGPSIPMMLGMRNAKPQTSGSKIIPLEKYELEYISMGSLVSEEETIVWRGPMVHQAIQQLLRDTSWSGGDFMILDLPPGTGDIQISLSQILSITGAVVVCTPQDLALIDARKAIAMFEKVQIPILGLIENMSFFVCPHCNKKTNIFSSKGVYQESQKKKIPFLGEIPLDIKIREASDKGRPIMLEEKNKIQEYYFLLAETLFNSLKK